MVIKSQLINIEVRKKFSVEPDLNQWPKDIFV